jgi:hypothetical protein
MTRVRPHRSESRPPSHAPAADPSSATATTRPVTTPDSSNCPCTASTAPLMTELSKPNRNPPTAAATASATALPLCLDAPGVPPGPCAADESVMASTLRSVRGRPGRSHCEPAVHASHPERGGATDVTCPPGRGGGWWAGRARGIMPR